MPKAIVKLKVIFLKIAESLKLVKIKIISHAAFTKNLILVISLKVYYFKSIVITT